MIQEKYIDESSVIADSSTIGYFSTVGKRCCIGEHTEIGTHVCIRNDVIIGNNCAIADRVSICNNVVIGDNTFIESGVCFVEKLNQRAIDNVFTKKTYIGKNVCIHSRAIIEAGSSISDGKFVDYGEVVKSEEA